MRIKTFVACVFFSFSALILDAAPPRILDCQVTSVVVGQPNLAFQVNATDPGGIKSITISLTKVDAPPLQNALSPVTWYAATPYSTNLTQVVTFSTPQVGNYVARITVANVGNETSYVDRPAYVMYESRSLPGATVTGTLMAVADGELVAPNPGSMLLASGSDVTYGATARIVLKPGFTAQLGSKFYALVTGVTPSADRDSDGDGLSDAQEDALGTNKFTQDSDGDGLLDGLEYLYGTSLASNIESAGPPSGFPASFDLILRTPNTTYGITTSNWSIRTVP